MQSLRVGRCLEWGAMNSRGVARGVVVFWDNRVLQLVELEVGNFQSLVVSRIVRTFFAEVLQGFMDPC